MFYGFLWVTEGCLVGSLVANGQKLMGEDWEGDWGEGVVEGAGLVFVLVLSLAFSLSLLALLWVQTTNLFKGLTTSERFSRHDSTPRSAPSGCSLSHCRAMCCNSDAEGTQTSNGYSAIITEENSKEGLKTPLIDA